MRLRHRYFVWQNEKGQALIVMSLLIMVVLMVVGITVDVGELIIHNIKLQNAADAGAYRGADTIALALNAVAIGNAAIDVLGIAAIFTHGATLEAIRAVQIAQDVVVSAAPASSVAAAALVASILNDAGMAVPLNRLNSSELAPTLMVRRLYFLPQFFGHRFPLWIVDSYRSTRQKPYGDRFLRLGVVHSGQRTTFVGKLLGKNLSIPMSHAVAEAYVSGGTILLPLPRWTYEARLTQVSVELPVEF